MRHKLNRFFFFLSFFFFDATKSIHMKSDKRTYSIYLRLKNIPFMFSSQNSWYLCLCVWYQTLVTKRYWVATWESRGCVRLTWQPLQLYLSSLAQFDIKPSYISWATVAIDNNCFHFKSFILFFSYNSERGQLKIMRSFPILFTRDSHAELRKVNTVPRQFFESWL